MKHLSQALILAAVAFNLNALAQNQNTKPKMPHAHDAHNAGTVLMFGDDHVEVASSQVPNQVTLFVSDKMRNPLPLHEVNLVVEIVDGKNISAAKVLVSAKASNAGLVTIPKEAQNSGALKIQLSRINPPKGHITSKGAQTVLLSTIFKPEVVK